MTSPLAIKLSAEAMAILVPRLEAFGSTLSPAHEEALERIVSAYSGLACGDMVGRYAADLPVGCGKSQSIVAWCAAVYRLGLPFSIAVAASRVESLCDLYRDLKALGVPEDRLGLIHSYGFDHHRADRWMETRDPKHLSSKGGRIAYASLPATEVNDQRQFLFVSHSLIKGSTEVERFNVYKGQERSLVAWDEACFVSDSRSVAGLSLKKALGLWGPEVEERSPQGSTERAALDYLKDCLSRIQVETDRQKGGAKPEALGLAPRSDVELTAYLEVLESRRPEENTILSHLRSLLRMSQGKLRVAQVAQSGSGVISYDIVVPEVLKRVVVLDASYAIRELEKMDRGIQLLPGFNGQVKGYSKVAIHHLLAPSGRESMERSFGMKAKEERKMSLEVLEILKNEIGPTEPVLFFTFKPKGRVDIIEKLKADLKEAGVDTNATVMTRDGLRPRFAWLTWGMETSISEFQYCPNIVFVGVLHRADHDLAACIAGQTGDLLAPISHDAIEEVRRSEIVHSLYQAQGRGSARGTTNGEAHPMRVWLTHPDEAIREPLSRIMPGVTWKTRTGKHVRSKQQDSRTAIIAEHISRCLRELPQSCCKISSQALRAKLGRQIETSRDTWKAAVQTVAAQGDLQWSLVGKSFVRCSSFDALFGTDDAA